jgi:hypothetical protein
LNQIHAALNERGRLVLIEPGAGHALRETSLTAVEQFGVQERDLHAVDLMRLCHDAGFAHVVVRPLSYMSGEIELSLDDLAIWNHWTRQTRPVRVLRKLVRLGQEFLGTAKRGALFEESLGMWVSRVLARHMSEQALVVASKSSKPDEAAPFSAEIRVTDSAVGAGLTRSLTVECLNTGTSVWRAQGEHRVQLGVQLLDDSRRVVHRDYTRTPLSRDVLPGEVCRLVSEIPRRGGRTLLRIDLVAEGIAWFDTGGPDGIVVTFDA